MMGVENLEVVEAKGAKWRIVHRMTEMERLEAFQTRFEIPHFMRLSPRHFKAYILYKNGVPIGYAAWNFFKGNRGKPVLRQIYIIPEERRKGYGTYLFQTSRRMFSNSEKLFLESPSRATLYMLLKLGVLERDGDVIKGKNVWFVPGM